MNTVQNRWFNRQIELLCKLKYIKRVQVEGLNRCIQLLRPYGVNMSVDRKSFSCSESLFFQCRESYACGTKLRHGVHTRVSVNTGRNILSAVLENEKDQLNLKNVIADDIPQSGICIDTSIEHQVYKLIVDSMKQGIIAKVTVTHVYCLICLGMFFRIHTPVTLTINVVTTIGNPPWLEYAEHSTACSHSGYTVQACA